VYTPDKKIIHDKLIDIGVTPVFDIRDAQPPCLLLLPNYVDIPRLDSTTYEVYWDCWAIADGRATYDPDRPSVNDGISIAFDMAMRVSGIFGVSRWEAITIALPNISPDGCFALHPVTEE
jgi:hypothetical protein